ncbi:MAG: thioredoxin family protein [Acidobacteria bacterium]|nr:thioredoxin family protein [Acidobacteriota bacterium]
MRRNMMVVLAMVAALTAGASQEEPEWSNVERDVWIDQSLQRPVLVYRSQAGAYLLLSDELPRALIVDAVSGRVSSGSKSEIAVSDDLSSVTLSSAVEPSTGSAATTEDGIVMASIAGRSVVIAPHRSPTGTLDVDRFLESYPSWRARMTSYKAGSDHIAALRAIDHPVDLSVVFATWCGDSRREVPRLLKAIEEADNPNLRVSLIGIDSEFQKPLDVIHEQRIINVPTVIVERDGEEIGRIVETPALATMEADLTAILSGESTEHQGRWSRGVRTTSGVYQIDFRNGDRGTETWEMFDMEAGGRLVHSIIRAPGQEREIWHRFGQEGESEFIEITDRTIDGVRRSRLRISDDHVRVTSRGNRSGIIDQFLGIPAGCVFATGSVLSDGLDCGPLSAGSTIDVTRYSVPLDECASVGCLETVKLLSGRSTTLETELGPMAVSEVKVAAGDETRRIWILDESRIPVRLEAADRLVVLVELNTAPPLSRRGDTTHELSHLEHEPSLYNHEPSILSTGRRGGA